jgi:ribosomal protein RSM22 (predicted rRNA methylase)
LGIIAPGARFLPAGPHAGRDRALIHHATAAFLREAIDRELHGIALADLARASELLSQRYRAEIRDGRFHVNDEPAARAYLTTRLPATYSAIARSLQAVAEARPDFAPRPDIGAGPALRPGLPSNGPAAAG